MHPLDAEPHKKYYQSPSFKIMVYHGRPRRSGIELEEIVGNHYHVRQGSHKVNS